MKIFQSDYYLLVVVMSGLSIFGCMAPPTKPVGVPVGSYDQTLAQEPEHRTGGDLLDTQDVTDGSAAAEDRSKFEVITGTGRVLGRARSSLKNPRVGDVVLNFRQAEIQQIASTVLGSALGRTYRIDPEVPMGSPITLETATPIHRDDVLDVLETALSASGIALIVQPDESVDLVPLSKATGRASRLGHIASSRRSLPGFAVEIVPLSFVSTSAIEPLVRALVPESVVYYVDATRNLLFLSGTGRERQAAREVVDRFDVDWMAAATIGLFELDFLQPSTLVPELEKIYASGPGQLADRVKLIPLDRIGTLVAITLNGRELGLLGDWVRRLDKPGGSDDRQLFVYELRNAKASDIADTLLSIYSEQENRSSVQGNSENSSRLKIVTSDENNALVIVGTQTEYHQLKSVIVALDVPPRQVLIEVVLAEVRLNDDLKYGLQWSIEPDEGTITLSDSTSAIPSSAFPGFSVLYSGSSETRAVLNALASITDVEVISSPKLVVLNNETANLQVGDQVPITTQTAQGTIDANAPVVNQVELRDTGVILEVTPRINEGGLVVLEVSVEVSEVALTTTSGIDSPTIQQRKFNSIVSVMDGATVALGGLIRENRSASRSGIPLLQDIPLLGNLFRTNENISRRTELVALITPRIINDARSNEAMTRKLLKQFERIEPWGESEPLRLP